MTNPAKASSRGSVIWYVGLGLVVLLGIVAVIVARGSDDSDESDVSDEVVAAQTSDVVVDEAGADPLSAFDGEAESDPALGDTIPTVSGTSLDGEPMTIGPDDGTAKVILFLAHWCPHCQAEVPRIVDHLADTPMPDDVELLAVSTSVAADRDNYPPSTWLDDEDWTGPVLADSEEGLAGEVFGLSVFPYFVAVDAEGQVVGRTSGEIPMEQFDELVQAAQSGTPMS